VYALQNPDLLCRAGQKYRVGQMCRVGEKFNQDKGM